MNDTAGAGAAAGGAGDEAGVPGVALVGQARTSPNKDSEIPLVRMEKEGEGLVLIQRDDWGEVVAILMDIPRERS